MFKGWLHCSTKAEIQLKIKNRDRFGEAIGAYCGSR